LFIGTGIIPSIAHDIEKTSIPTSGGKWWYVGGSGPGNYTRIQDAIDNASDGDTVFVYHGIYSDYFPEKFACVNIEKTLTLMGEDKRTTIIDGTASQYHGIYVRADYSSVTISGFTIQKATASGIWIESLTGLGGLNVIVHDTIIKENGHGLTICDVNNGEFYNNIISYSSNGIEIYGLNNGIIHNNSISNNNVAIFIYYSGQYIIEHNNIKNNGYGIRFYGRGIEIRYNNFLNNKIDAKGYGWYSLFTFLHNPLILFPRQTWEKNYWDKLITSMPKPIFATVTIYISIPRFFGFTIGVFRSIQCDWHPAKKPYDIPG
jgi:parallel beta-helix repeat protein